MNLKLTLKAYLIVELKVYGFDKSIVYYWVLLVFLDRDIFIAFGVVFYAHYATMNSVAIYSLFLQSA